MAASFIFDPSKGETPETVASRRRTADALAARIFGRTPHNVGEGLNALGQAWIAATMRDEANDAQKAGQAGANDAFSKIQGLLTGGMPVAAPAAAPTEAAPAPQTAPAVPMPGAAGGDVQSYLDAVKAAESGGNPNARNPNSTAGGLYQFTQGTWYDMIRKRPDLGLTPDGRFDPQQQERAMRAFTDQNAGVLTNAGIPINPANLYAAHFLGAGGARSVLAQPDNVPMPVAVGPEVVKANPFLANMTVGDFKNWTAKKMGGIQNTPVNTASAGAFPAPLPQTDDGSSLPPAAQPAQGNLPPMQNPGDLQQLIAAASNPWLNEGQRAVVSAVLKQRLQEQDPMRQLQMEKLRADIDKTRGKAGTTEYGLNPIYGTDDQGNPVLGTLGKDGSFKRIDTGGVKVSTGVDKIDLGTQFAIYDKKSGQLIGYQPKDLAGAEAARAEGKARGEAAASYRSMSSKLPGLEKVVGELNKLADEATYTYAGRALDEGRRQLGMEPRDAAIARTKYIAMVDNQILPLLRDTFGAQFTVQEGESLRATLGDPNKTPAEKKEVLNAFIGQKRRDIEALALQSMGGAPPSSAPAGPVTINGYKIEPVD